MPACTVMPVLAYPNVSAAVDWLCAAYGFTLRLRIGDHRAQLDVGDGAVVITALPAALMLDQQPGGRSLDSVMVRVEDVDLHYARAMTVRAEILQAPTNLPYGERQYVTADLNGRTWTFSQAIADVAPEKWGGTSIAP
jgi:uncharacterized glyoxalase superfamily protein PhnB